MTPLLTLTLMIHPDDWQKFTWRSRRFMRRVIKRQYRGRVIHDYSVPRGQMIVLKGEIHESRPLPD